MSVLNPVLLSVQADIWVNSFTLNGGPGVDMSVDGGVLDFSLSVRTSASNVPINEGGMPIFQYRIYISGSQ